MPSYNADKIYQIMIYIHRIKANCKVASVVQHARDGFEHTEIIALLYFRSELAEWMASEARNQNSLNA
jgi:hypothetical protein